MSLFRESKSDTLRGAALSAAQTYGDARLGEELLATLPKLAGGIRQQVLGYLLGKSSTADGN